MCPLCLYVLSADFVVRIMGRYGFSNCTNYIDDFLVQGNDEESRDRAQRFFVTLLRKLGFEVSESKLIRSSQTVTYLGINVNTVSMEYSLPLEKLNRLFPMIELFRGRDSATKLELQSLVGYLSHCSFIVKGGRLFTRRLITLICSLPHDRAVGQLGPEVKADLDWWLCFASFQRQGHNYKGPVSGINFSLNRCISIRLWGNFWRRFLPWYLVTTRD